MIKIEPPHWNVVLLRPSDLDIDAVAGGTENPQLVRAHEQVVVCSTHSVFIDEAVQEIAANHLWIDRDRTLVQHVRTDPLPQVGALGGVSSEDDRPTVKQRSGGVTRHVDDATKDAWHHYELEPQDPSAGMAKGAVRVTICAAGRSPTGTWGSDPGSGWEVGVHDLRLPWVARPYHAKN